MTFSCSICGSDKVQQKYWVEINTFKVVDPADSAGEDAQDLWCPVCEEHTEVTTGNIIKDTAKKTFTATDGIECYVGVLAYMCADTSRSILLTKHLKKELTVIFGKHDKVCRGEFFYHVWFLKYKEESFEIFTAINKGTSIYIDAELEDDKTNICLEFLKELEEKLLGVIDENS